MICDNFRLYIDKYSDILIRYIKEVIVIAAYYCSHRYKNIYICMLYYDGFELRFYIYKMFHIKDTLNDIMYILVK